MNSKKVLSEEEFISIKNKLISLINHFIQEINPLLDQLQEKMDYDEVQKMVVEKYYNPYLERVYYPVIEKLHQYDLGQLSSVLWEDFPFLSFHPHCFDLSGTKANIDFRNIEFYCEDYDFHGCNLQNIDNCSNILLNRFDHETIQENFDTFLDDNYPLDFRKKYIEKCIEFDDYIKLDDDCKNRFPNNFYRFTLPFFYQSFHTMERFNHLLKMWPDDISLLYQGCCKTHAGIGQVAFLNQIENIDDNHFHDALYSFLRNYILTDKRRIDISLLPKDFIEQNRDVLLIDEDISSEVLDRYYKSELLIDDLIKYPVLMQYAVKNEKILSYQIQFEFGKIKDHPNFMDIYTNHSFFLKRLFSLNDNSNRYIIINALENPSFNILSYLENNKNDSADYLLYYLLYCHQENNIDTSSMSLEEILQKRELRSTLENQLLDQIIEECGYDNIIRFQQETGFFTKSMYKNPLYYLEFMCSYMKQMHIHFDKDDYNSFEDAMCQVLSSQKDISFDYRDIDKKFQEKHSDIFLRKEELIGLNDEEKKEIMDSFYLKNMSPETIKKYPILVKILKNKNIDILFENTFFYASQIPYFLELCELYGKSFNYGYYKMKKMLEKMSNPSFLEVCDKVDEAIYEDIRDGSIRKYDEELPERFQLKYPSLFLPKDCDTILKDKFYHRKLTIEDFENNKDLLQYFTLNQVDIIRGLDVCFSKLIGLTDEVSLEKNNRKKLLIAKDYSKIPIEEKELQDEYVSVISERFDEVDEYLLKTFRTVLFRLLYSNSSKLSRLRSELIVPITKSSHPLEKLNEIEELYLKNHLPDVSKTYQVFRILHADSEGNLRLNVTESKSSPVLLGHSARSNELIISSDLIKVALESNNHSIRDYIHSIRDEYQLYLECRDNPSKLDEEGEEKLKEFSKILFTIYNESMMGKNSKLDFSSDVMKDIEKVLLALSPNQSIFYDVTDRITKMFTYYAGFEHYNELIDHMDSVRDRADKRNKERVKSDFTFHQGDIIKGINSPKYLMTSINNGILATEFLGSEASKEGDLTPLDTDFSYIDEDCSIDAGIKNSISRSYGPVWFVIEGGDPDIEITRNNQSGEISREFHRGKVELFETYGSGHYGIRTGIGSTHISYIVVEDYTTKLGLDVVMGGFYIPIVDRSGKLLFSPDDYEQLKSQMMGLSHYDSEDYSFSPLLVTPEVEEIVKGFQQSCEIIHDKGNIIKSIFKDQLQSVMLDEEECSFKIKECIDGDLSVGVIEVIDTGSTGRNTCSFDDCDYDYILRIDASIYQHPEKKEAIVNKIAEGLGVIVNGSGEIRAKDIPIDGIDGVVSVDVSFEPKKDDISYSTDMCLKDRFATIERQNPEKYPYVCANIIYAKELLKKAGCYYKHGHSKYTGFGGLGGVGVENWILQHGGSFIEAAQSFIDAAMNEEKNGFVDWNTFKKKYSVWDFGENFYKGENQHDEFVYDNMDKAGYQVMLEVLVKELEKYKSRQQVIEILDEEDVNLFHDDQKMI